MGEGGVGGDGEAGVCRGKRTYFEKDGHGAPLLLSYRGVFLLDHSKTADC